MLPRDPLKLMIKFDFVPLKFCTVLFPNRLDMSGVPYSWINERLIVYAGNKEVNKGTHWIIYP